MLIIKNVPIAIEPGVGALEAELVIKSEKGVRHVFVHLTRVPVDEKTLGDLPFIPNAQLPHVFSVTPDLQKNKAFVVYDLLGRLSVIYTKEKSGWERQNVADEHVGKTVTQFSVRMCFNSVKSLDGFLAAIAEMVDCANGDKPISPETALKAARLLARSRVSPVVLPVAVEKSKLGKIKL